jgi:Asp-tRNA(Asn)/Glu-tRNA(Gln) amidotransferase A subunit family amidase
MDYKNLSLLELDELIKSGKTTSEEIYSYFYDRVQKYNEELNAFTTLPLSEEKKDGLPIAVKDTYCEM